MSWEEDHTVHVGSGLTDTDTLVLKHGETFLVTEKHGDILGTAEGQLGLYHEGMRHLSHLHLYVGDRQRLLLLSSTVTEDNVLSVVELMNPDLWDGERLAIPYGGLWVRRERLLWEGSMCERIHLRSYAWEPVSLSLQLEVAADFLDLFEIRGVTRDRRGERLRPEMRDGSCRFSYRGLDGMVRVTDVTLDPRFSQRIPGRAEASVRLEPGQLATLEITVACSDRAGAGFEAALESARRHRGQRASRECRLDVSNELCAAWIHRAQYDLHMMVTETEHGPYPYAGVPWFSTPFGRDGIVTALQTLWVNPGLSAGVLDFLAERQAQTVDQDADAEPGKILHETRTSEMAALGEVPFGRYYGSVDSTPLFVVLAGQHHRVTADTPRAERLWPTIERALQWMDRFGDRDGDGFLEYERRTAEGLVQQGWKDSDDSVFHADGRPAEGPIALCEVQGYAYEARLEAARLADVLGRPRRARELREQAEELRSRFEERFWCEELGTYAIALDGDKHPCRISSSNAGHCLFSGVADRERARRVADGLLSESMFSGWGVRTLARGQARYNPMSYHNGSIWPHDNSLIAAGLARYGLREHAMRILDGLFGVSSRVDLHRLPELFCGFDRRPGERPTLYPVACSPQAWASGAVFLLLASVLGLRVEGDAQRLSLCRPALPAWLDWLTLKNLSVGRARLDLTLCRANDGVTLTVDRRDGDAEVHLVT